MKKQYYATRVGTSETGRKMKLHYYIISGEVEWEGLTVKSYGMQIVEGNKSESFDDIFALYNEVEIFADFVVRHAVCVGHLKDVIEDYVVDPHTISAKMSAEFAVC